MGKATKICRVCRETKSIEEFGKNKKREDGLMSECRSCRAEIRRDARKKRKAKKAQSQLQTDVDHFAPETEIHTASLTLVQRCEIESLVDDIMVESVADEGLWDTYRRDIYRYIEGHFGVSEYDKLQESRFYEALCIVKDIQRVWGKAKAVEAAKKDYYLLSVDDFNWLSKATERIENAGSKMESAAFKINSKVSESNSAASEIVNVASKITHSSLLAKQFNEKIENSNKHEIKTLWWALYISVIGLSTGLTVTGMLI